jgi:hypothetical protein
MYRQESSAAQWGIGKGVQVGGGNGVASGRLRRGEQEGGGTYFGGKSW